MARVIGSVSRNTNYEITIKKPIDARSLVKTYEDLTDSSNWINKAGNPICYNGMLVAVANTSDITYNGVYFLFDPNCTDSKKTPDVTNTSHWIRIGESSDVSSLITDLETLQSQLTSLQQKVDKLADDKASVQCVLSRTDLPTTGTRNIVYFIETENRSCTWNGTNYIWSSSEATDY